MRSFSSFVVLSLIVVCSGCAQRGHAEVEAREYLTRMYPGQTIQVSCMNYDTDQNGYVSCDAVANGHTIALECAATADCFFLCNDGCKLRPMMQNQPQ